DPLGVARGATRERDARLGRPDDLDVLPREPDAAAERLGDCLLAAEARRVALGRVAPGLAVVLLRPREAAVSEPRALERPHDPVDLDQVGADLDGQGYRDRSSQ